MTIRATDMTFDFEAWRTGSLARVEAALDGFIDAHSPADLGVAMRYGVLGGGKRLRALLVLAASEAMDGDADAAGGSPCGDGLGAFVSVSGVESDHAFHGQPLHQDLVEPRGAGQAAV